MRLQPGSVRPDRLGRGGGSATVAGGSTGDAFRRFGDLHAGDEPFQIALLFGVEVAGLSRGRRFEIGLGHSAGTRVGAAKGAGAALRGL